MKFTVVAASVAVVASVSAQGVGKVDPAKLPVGWCMTYTEDACRDTIAPKVCGANSTWTTACKSTFSSDMVCTSFQVSCTCTPLAGGEQKDISAEAFNETFSRFLLQNMLQELTLPSSTVVMPYNMCGNLLFSKNATGPGIVSGEYKPDGKKPNATATGANPSGTAAPAGGKNGASTLQMAFSTLALAAISLGLAVIPM
ncbi:hypothetical protein EC968_002633 [Mortierella alpina]|nr:hypothetical protein EC968_002633 [Mortierella alpina]